jgi:SAM-dependent methyltransferase
MAESERLTTEEYWDSVYKEPTKKAFSLTKTGGDFLKKIFGSRIKNYSEYILWTNLYSKFLPKGQGLKIVEIGSAPGWNLVKFNRQFGYIPYGVEYAPHGVEENRRQFKEAGLNPQNVIHADFFEDTLYLRYSNYFDLVESGGFIEHFTDVAPVVRRHVDLLKPGGTLIIIIPNFRGLNNKIFQYFNEKVLRMHNLEIMRLENFKKVFADCGLEEKYANYYGTFNFGMFNTDGHGFKYYLHRFLIRFQVLLNILFIFVLGNHGFEGKLWSPYLIYIGTKPAKIASK